MNSIFRIQKYLLQEILFYINNFPGSIEAHQQNKCLDTD